MKFNKKIALNIELIIVICIFIAIALGFFLFKTEIRYFIKEIVTQFGLLGLFGITLVMDTIIQPISPDLLTLGYSMSDLNTLTVSFIGGIASILAGLIGYGIGHLLEEEGLDKYIGKKRYKKIHKLFVKHGFWAIMIGALSPVPFSAICWSAGAFKMPWKFFCISIIITRLPRFLLAGYIGTLF